jgi:hypothetical protein
MAENIRREREGSLKFVQILFALLALVSLVAALAVSLKGTELGLPEGSVPPIALAFLMTGAVDTALLYFWEHIFKHADL